MQLTYHPLPRPPRRTPRGRASTQAARWKRRRTRDLGLRLTRLYGVPMTFEWQVRAYLAAERIAMGIPRRNGRSHIVDLTGL